MIFCRFCLNLGSQISSFFTLFFQNDFNKLVLEERGTLLYYASKKEALTLYLCYIQNPSFFWLEFTSRLLIPERHFRRSWKIMARASSAISWAIIWRFSKQLEIAESTLTKILFSDKPNK